MITLLRWLGILPRLKPRTTEDLFWEMVFRHVEEATRKGL